MTPDTEPSTVADLPRIAGDFELQRELGRGGMGVVYEATHTPTGRAVALKVLSPDLEYSDEAYARFEREARLAASISHPRCVFVLGAHEVDGSPAISMELMTGETLQDRLDEAGAFPVERAIACTLQLLDGLTAAQHAGVIHRDIKPGNCFYAPDGHLKIGDFGLSRSLVSDARLTVAGQFLGSPMYASPEQVRGEAVDVRSDVYSLGATLHHMLAGTPPFEGSGFGEILAHILADDPPPIEGIPKRLARIVGRAMHKDPGKRFPDHGSMHAALKALTGDGMRPASFGKRLAAGSGDFVLAMFLPGMSMKLAAELAGWPMAEHPALENGLQIAATAILILYIPVADAGFGRTLFKQYLGLRVVGRASRRHEPLRGMVRGAVFLLLVGLMLSGPLLSSSDDAGMGGLAFLAGLFLLLSTVRPRNGWRLLHDALSGTEVVEVTRPKPAPAGVTSEVPDVPRLPVEGMPRELGNYAVDGLVATSRTGRWYVGSDPQLERRVWLHVVEGDAPPPSPARHASLSLQVIDQFPADSLWVDVHEYPGGSSLVELSQSGAALGWSRCASWLADIADVLDAERDLDLGRVWIDSAGRLRLLEQAIAHDRDHADAPLDTLAAATALLLPLSTTDPIAMPGLPLHAEAWLARVHGRSQPFERCAVAANALRALADQPVEVVRSMRRRAFVVSACLCLPGLLLGGVFLAFALSFNREGDGPGLGMGFMEAMLLTPFVVGLVLCFALRGGLGLRTAGLAVRDNAGRHATRLRCTWRAIVTWLPIVTTGFLAVYATQQLGLEDLSSWVGTTAALVTALAVAITSVTAPRALQDRLAGTHLVPR